MKKLFLTIKNCFKKAEVVVPEEKTGFTYNEEKWMKILLPMLNTDKAANIDRARVFVITPETAQEYGVNLCDLLNKVATHTLSYGHCPVLCILDKKQFSKEDWSLIQDFAYYFEREAGTILYSLEKVADHINEAVLMNACEMVHFTESEMVGVRVSMERNPETYV